MNFFNFAIYKKNNDFLAVITNQNAEWEIGHYNEQGYIFLMYVSALNANSAIEIAKQNTNSEIGRLQSELAALRQEYQILLKENNNLKFSSSFGSSPQSSHFYPLEVLGLDKMPDKEELKKRFKLLSQKYHPDRGGSHLLMTLINEANESLKRQLA